VALSWFPFPRSTDAFFRYDCPVVARCGTFLLSLPLSDVPLSFLTFPERRQHLSEFFETFIRDNESFASLCSGLDGKSGSDEVTDDA
jgi:hypothetical protein